MSFVKDILRRVQRRRARMLVLQRYPLASEMKGDERPAIERGWTGELAARHMSAARDTAGEAAKGGGAS